MGFFSARLYGRDVERTWADTLIDFLQRDGGRVGAFIVLGSLVIICLVIVRRGAHNKTGMKKTSTRSRADLGLGLREIIYVLEQTDAELEMTRLRQQVLVPLSVQNGSLEASLISFRALDEFISSSGSREDDIKASHYGYVGNTFLTDAERIGMNKRLAHLTWHRITRMKWKFQDMTARMKGAMLDFFRHVEQTLPSPTEEELQLLGAAVRFCLTQPC